MAASGADDVLIDRIGGNEGAALWAKRALAVALGVATMAVLAKVKVPLWPSPVPITMQTFGVLLIGAGYGARLGLATMAVYLAVGAIGYDVFTSSSAENAGLAYMLGGTGGYLFGYLLAVLALGAVARRGWDRGVLAMAGGMLLASLLIYLPGVLWLRQFAESWAQTFAWGVTPFLIGDAMKLALAALLVPTAWRLLGRARG